MRCYPCFRVEDMMKRSFSEIDSARSEQDRKHNLETLLSRKQQLQTLDCQLCTSDIHQYYCSCAQLLSLREETQVCHTMIHCTSAIFFMSEDECEQNCNQIAHAQTFIVASRSVSPCYVKLRYSTPVLRCCT